MKANRKFLKQDDDAVSPVIAVILMVAITVVLAATVYVWVSGFGAQGSQPAKSVSLTSAGSISNAVLITHPHDANTTSDKVKNYTISSASPGLKYKDLKLTLEGAAIRCMDDWDGSYDAWRVLKGGNYLNGWQDCNDTTGAGPDAVVSAGDVIQIYDDGGASLSGKTLRILDANANSIVLTLTIG